MAQQVSLSSMVSKEGVSHTSNGGHHLLWLLHLSSSPPGLHCLARACPAPPRLVPTRPLLSRPLPRPPLPCSAHTRPYPAISRPHPAAHPPSPTHKLT
ncbi:hypothetical protein E2C01_003066 [Portunus trituberculatus]|uniref:Uncharacterized protein n=1 Tax=Portunus trituberculatus TaxID=210409 RepID=A0A5B7CNR7_PORTR|nr:hypothetical protein [Portunus trituberculatus]